MNYDELLLEKKDGIVTITLNVPEKMNSLTMKMRKELPRAIDEIARDDEVKVVIVTGAGRAFCAGSDLESLKGRFIDGSIKQTRSERLQVVGYWADVFPRLDKPVIAAINGACVGAGFAMALSCDIRIASEKARFGAVWINIGLVPDCATTYLLPHLIGTSKALEIMFGGELFNAGEAERIGLVNRVVPPDDLMKVCQELAAKIAQQPPIALELTKRLVYRNIIENINRQLDLESYAQELCEHTEDFKESVLAFLDKRPRPKFKGT